MVQLKNVAEVFGVFLLLGLRCFGGPMAHLGYFHQEFVVRRKWVDEHAYGDLVSLCQFLPGPASSQLGMAIGLLRGGITGSIAAWLGFTLPSAIMMVCFGLWYSSLAYPVEGGWIHGLKIVTVAVVAQAVFVMGRSLCPDVARKLITLLTAAFVLVFPSIFSQIGAMVLAAFIGRHYLKSSSEIYPSIFLTGVRKKTGVIFLGVFLGLLLILPVASVAGNQYAVKLFDSFYRTGSLVFGGGHVVLPLLQMQTVNQSWVSRETFLTGYGLAQGVPGPLFTFAAYLGAVSNQVPSGWLGAGIALVAIFLPGYLLVVGILPFWEKLRSLPPVRQAMMGVNASVVGILLAALYQPVMTGTIGCEFDACAAAVVFSVLMAFRRFSWIVPLLTVLSALIFSYIGIQ
jgi:chromate transporter